MLLKNATTDVQLSQETTEARARMASFGICSSGCRPAVIFAGLADAVSLHGLRLFVLLGALWQDVELAISHRRRPVHLWSEPQSHNKSLMRKTDVDVPLQSGCVRMLCVYSAVRK